MNDLNSVLIEGIIIEAAQESAPTTCRFCLVSSRNGKESPFAVRASGRLAKACIENLTMGRGLRVVGYLESAAYRDDDGIEHYCVVINAEHVEFEPRKAN
jgi:single-stranded DNA-binding protein